MGHSINAENDHDSHKYVPNGDLTDHEAYGATYQPSRRRGGLRGVVERGMDLLVRHGVEERGIQPVPDDVRPTQPGHSTRARS